MKNIQNRIHHVAFLISYFCDDNMIYMTTDYSNRASHLKVGVIFVYILVLTSTHNPTFNKTRLYFILLIISAFYSRIIPLRLKKGSHWSGNIRRPTNLTCSSNRIQSQVQRKSTIFVSFNLVDNLPR